ncbi:hypothetical protein TH4_07915 [Thalassospira tepidiphila MCCC 1A03514]|uniref:Uncharacterized protein n=1 Tax=Thalassospira tepidiphila MCCC 1A03514 TaxID=1177930 RepID=A0A853L1L1_9PROT|nr:hypothetical protein TH4_07915 [Thalassospira tepidiphila MCCC 1A03514]
MRHNHPHPQSEQAIFFLPHFLNPRGNAFNSKTANTLISALKLLSFLRRGNAHDYFQLGRNLSLDIMFGLSMFSPTRDMDFLQEK